jgi:hypothetical protein
MKKVDSNRYGETGSVVEKNEVEGVLRNIAQISQRPVCDDPGCYRKPPHRLKSLQKLKALTHIVQTQKRENTFRSREKVYRNT